MEQIWGGGQGDVLAELKAMEGRVRKRREEDRGWASTRNMLRKRIVAVESWHGAIHSVVAPRRTGTRSWGCRRVDTRKKNKTHAIWFVLAKKNGLFFKRRVNN